MRRERRGRGDGDGDAVADGQGRHDAPDVVDMAGDDMSAKLVADLQRAFEVEAAPRVPHPRRGSRERFGASIDREPAPPAVALRVPALVAARETPAHAGARGPGTEADPLLAGPD